MIAAGELACQRSRPMSIRQVDFARRSPVSRSRAEVASLSRLARRRDVGIVANWTRSGECWPRTETHVS